MADLALLSNGVDHVLQSDGTSHVLLDPHLPRLLLSDGVSVLLLSDGNSRLLIVGGTTVPNLDIAPTTIIQQRYHNSPSRYEVRAARRGRLSRFFFIPTPVTALREYLYANVGVPFLPADDSHEYLYANVGFGGTNTGDLHVPHKQWPIQNRDMTLAMLRRPPTDLDTFMSVLVEKIGEALQRTETPNYIQLEGYADTLRANGVWNPAQAGVTLGRVYESFGIHSAANNVVNDFRDKVPNAELLASAYVDRIIRDNHKKTTIWFDVQRWSTNSATRTRIINTQPDYLSHRIDNLNLPDDLMQVVHDVRSRMARQERTNLVAVQNWANSRFVILPSVISEYIYANVINGGMFAGGGSGMIGGGIIGQPLAIRVGSPRSAASQRRRGRVFWP